MIITGLRIRKVLLCKTLTNIVKGDRILNDVFCPRLIYSYGCKTSGMESAIRIIDRKKLARINRCFVTFIL